MHREPVAALKIRASSRYNGRVQVRVSAINISPKTPVKPERSA